MARKLSIEKYLRSAYNSRSTKKLNPVRPLTKFAFDTFALLNEESEEKAILGFLRMRDKCKDIKNK